MSNQITVRGLGTETAMRLQDLANKRHTSLNKIAVLLLRKGTGLRVEDESPETVGTSLDAFIGSWSPKQEKEFAQSVRNMGQIDEDLWR
jgi:hypothetical protein